MPVSRVVSLLPSATEALFAVGGGDLLVGRSHECDYPTGALDVPVLTARLVKPFASAGIDPKGQSSDSGEIDRQVRSLAASGEPLYRVNEDLLVSLRPDVILTQDFCHVCSIDLPAVRRIASAMSPVPEIVSLNPSTVEGVLDDLITVGRAVGRAAQAQDAVARLRERMYAAQDFVNPYDDGPRVCVLEWTDPLFVGGHWTPQLVERAGARHTLNPTRPIPGAGAGAGPIGLTLRAAGPSATVTAAEFARSQPQGIVIAPCGLTLGQARAAASRLFAEPWWEEAAAAAHPSRGGKGVVIVDGNQFFNRPGPRLVDALEFLVGWVQERPELIPAGFVYERVL